MKFLVSMFFLVLGGAVEASELKEGQAFVIVNLESEYVLGLGFRALDSKSKFKVKSRHKNKKIVKAGEYYIERYDTAGGNVRPVKFKPPKSSDGKFVIQPNTVTYLGDWEIGVGADLRLKYRAKVMYREKSIKSYLSKYPYLRKYELWVATSIGAMRKLSWEEVE